MGKLVLITRPMEQAKELAEKLKLAGFEPIIQPLTMIQHIPFVINVGQKPDILILSSQNALGDFKFPADWIDIPVFCVGSKTAETAFYAGFKQIFSGNAGIKDVMEKVRSTYPVGVNILYLRGQDVHLSLKGLMTEYDVEEKITYEAQAVDKFLPETLGLFKNIGFITLFSARAGSILKNLVIENDLLLQTKGINLLCLSSAVVESVKDLKWKSCNVADEPSSESMLEKLKSLS